MTILLIDSFDSFVYIIDDYLRTLGARTRVVRSNLVRLSRIAARPPDAIVLGPGPGHPRDTIYHDVLARFAGSIPILGVCLGHQAIGLAFGCEVGVLRSPRHGKTSPIVHDGRGCFSGLAPRLLVTRYHSLFVRVPPVLSDLRVTATSCDDSVVMGLRHVRWPIEGVQFHPESIATDGGHAMFENFLRLSCPAFRRRRLLSKS